MNVRIVAAQKSTQETQVTILELHVQPKAAFHAVMKEWVLLNSSDTTSEMVIMQAKCTGTPFAVSSDRERRFKIWFTFADLQYDELRGNETSYPVKRKRRFQLRISPGSCLPAQT